MNAASTPLPTPEGPGSVSEAPHLPEGFTDTFTSRYVDAGGLRQHAVIGGDGPPLLLVHGWPEQAAPETPVRFRVLIDGQPPGAAHGTDVDAQGDGTVSEPRLYQLVRQPGPITERTFEVTFLDPGVQAYAFTFG
jgi:hypothetical protein